MKCSLFVDGHFVEEFDNYAEAEEYGQDHYPDEEWVIEVTE